MKILQINTVYGRGSTGRIVRAIQKEAQSRGYNCIAACRYTEKDNKYDNVIEVSSWLDCHIHNRLARITMLQGCFSHFRTAAFFKKVSRFNPDLIHLHNLHGNYINYGMLLSYIKKHEIPVIVTMHDCWLMTGFCAGYDYVGCSRWKEGCGKCPQKNRHGRSLIDLSSYIYQKKRRTFSDVYNMTLVTPSDWLKKEVCQSYLAGYPIYVIPNGINLDQFYVDKTERDSLKVRYLCSGKKLVLGVAYQWNDKKGLNDFIQLSAFLPDDYRIVLIGLDKINEIPSSPNIIAVPRTESTECLKDWYNAADVFVNLTYEDNFPTVNLEALACGTPVITYRTGGSPESVDDTCGYVVEKGDIRAVADQILRACETLAYSEENCVVRAAQFDATRQYSRYVDIYEDIVKQ